MDETRVSDGNLKAPITVKDTAILVASAVVSSPFHEAITLQEPTISGVYRSLKFPRFVGDVLKTVLLPGFV
jgi:hypothetical protein